MSLHSSEPWSTPRSNPDWQAKSSLDYYTYPIADAEGRQFLSLANPADAERIVLCVNACAGISDKELGKIIAWRESVQEAVEAMDCLRMHDLLERIENEPSQP